MVVGPRRDMLMGTKLTNKVPQTLLSSGGLKPVHLPYRFRGRARRSLVPFSELRNEFWRHFCLPNNMGHHRHRYSRWPLDLNNAMTLVQPRECNCTVSVTSFREAYVVVEQPTSEKHTLLYHICCPAMLTTTVEGVAYSSRGGNSR